MNQTTKVKNVLPVFSITDFPILQQKVYGKRLIYLDNSATTQKPKPVLQAMNDYYEKHNANVHRAVHVLSQRATTLYEQAHEVVAKFIGAEAEEVIFTSGTTASLNLLAYSLCTDLEKGDEIILTEMEHHSNLVPWQQIAKEKNLVLKFIPLTKDYCLDLRQAKKMITTKTKIVSVTQMSNVLGTINPVPELVKLAHDVGAIFVVDAAQSVPHQSIDVKKLDCDFLAFSGHKMCGPTGMGVLYGKKHLLQKMKPFHYGGGMIREVRWDDSSWNDLPGKFEAGTPNIAGAVGLMEAIRYLEKVGMDNIEDHEHTLTAYALKKLSGISGLQIIGPASNPPTSLKQPTLLRGPVISFVIEGIHPHDLGEVLDKEGIAVRGGHHCAMPLMAKLGIAGTTRASFYFYNTDDDVDALVKAVKKAQELFG
ncbi:cysteine desulfurase [Candidatus Woesearchaeota archaeon]|nr:cysteine desulfurase [Candidatus Woesearchaeota archaeon]